MLIHMCEDDQSSRKLYLNCCINGTRYSGHLNSRLMGLLVNMTKQARFPTTREGRAVKVVPSEVESLIVV